MNVNDDVHFVIARLEEEMLDIAEQEICAQTMGSVRGPGEQYELGVKRHTDFGSILSVVTQTVLVDLQLAWRDTLVVESGTNMHVHQFVSLSTLERHVNKV